MIRKAFKMAVAPDKHQEYERRHNPIWAQLADTMRRYGIHNFSIYLDEETSTLFAYVEIENEEEWNAMAKTEIQQRWWRYMKDIMPTNPDNSPITKTLKEVFHQE